MITKSEPISTFVAAYEESGLSLGVFPAKTNDKRYVIRAIDPDAPDKGLAYVASFAKGVKEADRPSDAKSRKIASDNLNEILHDLHAGAEFEMLTCLIDQESVEKFNFSSDDLGKSYLLVSRINTVFSDSYADIKEETKAKGATVRD